jgi:hypothetical protein
MKPWTNALYVSLISRCDSAAIVLKTSELLPDPETPVNTVNRRLGMSRLTSRRLFSRAPRTSMEPQAPVSPASAQPAPFFASSPIRFSTAGVSVITANSVGHMSPSSSCASGWKPKVE